MQNNDEALSSIILVGRGLLVKMLLTLETHPYTLITLCTLKHLKKHFRDSGKQNSDMALPRTSPAGRGQILITLESRGIYSYQILHTYRQSGRSCSFSENAYNS